MGKIRVTDLARMIGMAEQDLIFKLRSIGARVEGEDAQVDTEVLKAVLEGKRLATPREVIVRDEAAPLPGAPPRAGGAPPAARRLPPEPPRPRPRSVIHKVEPRIPTIPVRERAEPQRPAEAEEPEQAPLRADRATLPPPPVLEDAETVEATPREQPRESVAPAPSPSARSISAT